MTSAYVETWGVWKKKDDVCKQTSSLSVVLDEIPTATCEPSEIAMWKGLKLRWGT